MDATKFQILFDELKEFDDLWEASGVGPDASVRSRRRANHIVGIPRSARQLRLEDFRSWLLP